MTGELTQYETDEFNAFTDQPSHSGEAYLNRLVDLNFTDQDRAALKECIARLAPKQDEINQRMLQFLSTELTEKLQARSEIQIPLLLWQVHTFYFCPDDSYQSAFVKRRIITSLKHYSQRIDLDVHFSVFNKYRSLLNTHIKELCGADTDQFMAYADAVSKIISFNIEVLCEYYLYKKQNQLNRIQEQRIQNFDKLISVNYYDKVTGLPNQFMLKEILTEYVGLAKQKDISFAVVKLGLDHFNKLNISEGDDIGDLILKMVSNRLQRNMAKDDFLSCWEGYAFYLILKLNSQDSEIDPIFRQINELFRLPLTINDKNIQITCSMGIALFPRDHREMEYLIKYSNNAMLQAIESGGNRYQFYNREMDAQLEQRNSIANELFHAIEHNQFVLNYQPVIDLQSGEVVSMEALIRWYHPTRGTISPNRFIYIAEDISIIHKLGEWIIRQVCIDINLWKSQGVAMPRTAINVSPKQLHDPGFIDILTYAMREFDVGPENITLEITESLLLGDSKVISDRLKIIKNMGISLSMDDFGTGYSALSYLKHYPFDYVKIDQSFIRDIVSNSGDAAIANAVISMTHSMGIKVVAEGVETEEQCAFLSKHMCDYIQGYMVARPMSIADTQNFLSSQYRLPEHLRRIAKSPRSLLLVGDEPARLASIQQLLRQDGYQILTAGSGAEALEILAQQVVNVIVADQGMPAMTGVEFLRLARPLYPETIRIVLSGYTGLEPILDAINEGVIYKFLTKPWDDQLFREQMAEAFRQHEMAQENRILGMQIQTANHELATANRQLQDLVQRKEKQIDLSETSLGIAREALQYISTPVMGIDDEGMIAFVNCAAEAIFTGNQGLLGAGVDEVVPGFMALMQNQPEGEKFTVEAGRKTYLASVRSMGKMSTSLGRLITFYES